MTPIYTGESAPLFKALAAAQGQMSSAKKGKTNTFFGSVYADVNSVLQAALPALNANDLSVTQHPGFDADRGMVTMTTVIHHASGARMESTAAMVPNKKDNQGIGSCQTYLRRYSLVAILGIPQVDDDGEDAMGRNLPAPPPAPPPPKPKATRTRRRNQSTPKSSPSSSSDSKHHKSWDVDKGRFFMLLNDIADRQSGKWGKEVAAWDYDEINFVMEKNSDGQRVSWLTPKDRTTLLSYLEKLTQEKTESLRAEYAKKKAEAAENAEDAAAFDAPGPVSPGFGDDDSPVSNQNRQELF